jgi:organic hydroperoxide reductase OsmC/OhrA
MARPGSTHGYDVIDFNRLNPELGDEAAFDDHAEEAKEGCPISKALAGVDVDLTARLVD